MRERLPRLPLPDWIVSVALVYVSVLVVGGLVLLARAGHVLLVANVVGSIALIVVTPWPGQFSRYLVPLAPILSLAFVAAVAAVIERARRSGGRWWRAAAAVCLMTLGAVLVQDLYTVFKFFTKHHEPAVMADASGKVHQYRLFFYDRTWRLHDDALDWLAKEGSRSAVVATSTPHLAYLRTGLQAIMPPYEADPARAAELLRHVPVTYLIVDQLAFLDVSRRYAGPVAASDSAGWPAIYAVNDSGPRIYRWSGEPHPPAVGSK